MPSLIAADGERKSLLFAVDEDRALVGLVGAVQRLHQRRLAGAVLADDRVDRAGADLEVDAVVGDDTGKALHDVAQLDGVVAAVGRVPPCVLPRHSHRSGAVSSRWRRWVDASSPDFGNGERRPSPGDGRLSDVIDAVGAYSAGTDGTTIVPSMIAAFNASSVGTYSSTKPPDVE